MESSGPPTDLLRLTTAGSVDDGKSTLIGRLLLDTRSLVGDQVRQIEQESQKRGDPYLDLALFTDGLKAEREQRITIDVAYRYFATPKRKFIIADCPGHVQYTRNMVTGASTAHLAIVLVDARKGVLTQSRRHAFLASLLHIPHVIVAINKMDLVDYDAQVYAEICREFGEFASRLELGALSFIPISALQGDNVTSRSPNMPWYQGSTLLHQLDSVNLGAARNLVDFRFPVQYVLRPHQDFRGFAGRVASGRISPGERIVALPSGQTSQVRSLETYQGSQGEAFCGDSVVITLADEIDLSRGDLIVRENNLPRHSRHLDVTTCWLSEVPLNPKITYQMRIGTRQVAARIERVDYRIDVDTMHREASSSLALNDIGRLQISLAEALYFDTYRRNRLTGSFILVDPTSHNTVAAGMIRGTTPEAPLASTTAAPSQSNLQANASLVSPQARRQRRGHSPAVLWFTGLSGSGKSTLVRHLEKALFERQIEAFVLDGDNVRTGLCSDLGFSAEDRRENIRRSAQVAALAYAHGSLVLCSFISPYQADRQAARELIPPGQFLEFYVHCPLEVCRQRDPKGLYAKVDRGTVQQFTGVHSPYEIPEKPHLLLDTSVLSIEQAVAKVLHFLTQSGILDPSE